MLIVQIKVINFCANMDYADVCIERCGTDLNNIFNNIEQSETLHDIYGELETEIKISEADLVGGVLRPVSILAEEIICADYNVFNPLTSNTDVVDMVFRVEEQLSTSQP